MNIRIRMKLEKFQLSENVESYNREINKEEMLEVIVPPEEAYKLFDILKIYAAPLISLSKEKDNA